MFAQEEVKYLTTATMFEDEVIELAASPMGAIIVEVTREEEVAGYVCIRDTACARPLDARGLRYKVIKLCSGIGAPCRVLSRKTTDVKLRLVDTVSNPAKQVIVFGSLAEFDAATDMSGLFKRPDVVWRPFTRFTKDMAKGNINTSQKGVEKVYLGGALPLISVNEII